MKRERIEEREREKANRLPKGPRGQRQEVRGQTQQKGGREGSDDSMSPVRSAPSGGISAGSLSLLDFSANGGDS